jgi:hypothetical protein
MIALRIALLAAAFITATPTDSRGQALNDALREFDNPSYQVRREAFYRVLSFAMGEDRSYRGCGSFLPQYARRNPQIRPALINLLERENRPDPGTRDLTEDGYYGDVIACVASLRDPRALNALLDALYTGDGAGRGVADLGGLAVPPLLQRLRESEYPGRRLTAARTLGFIAEGEPGGDNRQRIRAALLVALRDPDMDVRWSVITALRSFSGPDIRAEMERIARTDPAPVAGGHQYPIRAAAREWLRRDDSLRAAGGAQR